MLDGTEDNGFYCSKDDLEQTLRELVRIYKNTPNYKTPNHEQQKAPTTLSDAPRRVRLLRTG